ncbi:hypothetical protein [Sphingomonas solaris]|uniref:Uncharacterized protein n=1 Tax=Alterirhizorhabdus solaris TaxID=2529389 RepID=A0A558QYN5_9SPHN|nr:hypothetical protein [Sphingomonas solaris]TVV72208.1 hypothetical protein FOY91_15075 [Sphingomonas solaris]
MGLSSIAELDAARAAARRMVHRRALKAAARAAAPFGFGRDALADLVADVQAEFRLTPTEAAELAPRIHHSLADLVAAYAPAALGAEALAELTAVARANPVAQAAGRFRGHLARRVIGRFVAGRGLLGAMARRAWVIPAALGGGAAASYELLGRRAINQCYAYLRGRLETAPAALR